jgi:hypothetical protein
MCIEFQIDCACAEGESTKSAIANNEANGAVRPGNPRRQAGRGGWLMETILAAGTSLRSHRLG